MAVRRIKNRGGQALVMFALALTAICGFLSLAVDLGLAYSIRKSAQSAADAAALAGAQQALTAVGTAYYTSCPTGVLCQTSTCLPSTSNPPKTNIDSACLYALNNGFSTQGNNGYAQNVTVTSNFNRALKTTTYAPGIKTMNYYVNVEITEQIPYLFGGVLNNSLLFVDVNATAGITQSCPGGAPTCSASAKKSTISLVQ